MKRIIIFLLFAMSNVLTFAQSNFLDKYSETKGVSYVYISKAMLSLMPNMKAEGVNIGKIASKLDGMRILSCESHTVIAKLKNEIAAVIPKNGYNELMRINDDGEKVVIYMKENKSGSNEFVLVESEKDELQIIQITGKLTLKEIQGIINK